MDYPQWYRSFTLLAYIDVDGPFDPCRCPAGALACLAGRAAKYYLRTAAVTLGRTTDSKGDVDVDLTGEEQQHQQQQAAAGTGGVGGEQGEQAGSTGPPGGAGASQVSRRQALIRLGADGVFRLTNMGRQVVLVNGVEVGGRAGGVGLGE